MGQRLVLASGGRHTRVNEPGGAAYNHVLLSIRSLVTDHVNFYFDVKLH